MHRLIFILLIFSNYVHSSPLVTERTKYFSVEGTSLRALFSDLNRKSPIRENGEVFHAYTASYVTWNWRWKKRNGSCNFTQVTSKVDITYTLPKLTDIAKKSGISKDWMKWHASLVRHERNHAKNAVDIASVGNNKILRLSSRKNCKDLDKAAKNIVNILIKELHSRDKKYDVMTNHGESEGAALYVYF